MRTDIGDLIEYVEHVGFAVPDLDQAVRFFEEGLGAEELYRSTRVGEGDFMTRTFAAPADSRFTLAMLRLPPNLNIELFEWNGGQADGSYPRLYHVGGHHLCLHVHDIDQACTRIADMPGVRQLGEIKTVPEGSQLAGSRWAYLIAPWGLPVELVDRSAVTRPPRLIRPGHVEKGPTESPDAG